MPVASIRIIHTSDIHGCLFPYDFYHKEDATGSISRVKTYVDSLRKVYGENLLLLDSGDILQGQPTFFYSSFIEPQHGNLAAKVMNLMQYDCIAIGNHDIETGHAVYDKFREELSCPLLAANIINTKTGEPYFKPYHIIRRQGIKIAVIGMMTPTISYWLDEKLWEGMKLLSIKECASMYVSMVKEREKPDIIIGLFHSGWEGGLSLQQIKENVVREIAETTEDFDLILFGHDHKACCKSIINKTGKKVFCVNPSSDANMVGDIEICIEKNTSVSHKNTNLDIEINAKLVSMAEINPDEDLVQKYNADYQKTSDFTRKEICKTRKTIRTRDCYFGSAPFTDFIHYIQMDISGADISFTAPLSYDETIYPGSICIGDLFNMYKYENLIYALSMKGTEIVNYLEMSYDLWVNTMHSAEDGIMKTQTFTMGNRTYTFFKNLVFNFDSAAGIIYTVDVSKSVGNRIKILSMADGRPFLPDAFYKVAMHSYRGNGGTEFLTKGAGIPHHILKERIIFKSARDMRYYMMRELEKYGDKHIEALNNWKFIPEEWTLGAIERDRAAIFHD